MTNTEVQNAIISAARVVAEQVVKESCMDTTSYVLVTDYDALTDTYTVTTNGITYPNTPATGSCNIGDRVPMMKMGGDITKRIIVNGGNGTEVDVTTIQTTGTHIADITVDGTVYQLYAPTGGSSSTIYYGMTYSNGQLTIQERSTSAGTTQTVNIPNRSFYISINGRNLSIKDGSGTIMNTITLPYTFLTAGSGVTITDEGVISAAGASYTASNGIVLSNNNFTLDENYVNAMIDARIENLGYAEGRDY